MSNLFCEKVSLLLPVFKGGDLFPGAIKSIEESGLNFANVFISFNGSSEIDYDNFNNLKDFGGLKYTYTIFQTLRDLDAVDHALFIANKLKRFMANDASLFLLAHDDRIVPVSDPSSLYAYLEQTRFCETVYFPRYDCCIAGDYDNIHNIYGKDECFSPSGFFWFTLENNLATNMSGMIVPFFAWEQANLAGKKAASGARFEHFCCIAQNIKAIRFTTKYGVKVGARADSDGATLSLLQHRKASLVYMLLYARNHGVGGVFLHFKYSFFLLKKSVACIIAWVRKVW